MLFWNASGTWWKMSDVALLAREGSAAPQRALVLDDRLCDKVYDNITEAMKPEYIAAGRAGVDFEFADSVFDRIWRTSRGRTSSDPPNDDRFIAARERLERYRSDKLNGRMSYQRFDLQYLDVMGCVSHPSGRPFRPLRQIQSRRSLGAIAQQWLRKYDRG